jgi:uncharacterized protein (DUF2062 family)
MGVASGLLWGLTPTVGVQITGLSLQKALAFALNKISGGYLSILEFNFPLAIALTWISNPFTMLFLYFGYYYLGALILPGYEAMGWTEFSALLAPLTEVSGLLGSLGQMGAYFAHLWDVLKGIGDQVLIPLLFGSFLVAIPFSIGGYFGTRLWLFRLQNHKSSKGNSNSQA